MIDYKETIKRLEAFTNGYWVIPENIDTSKFDFEWRPNPTDKPYIHQFGTQWQRTGGPKFVVPGAEGVKFQDCQKAVRLPNKNNFKILVECDIEFDYSWHPDDTEPDFIYVFGNQYLGAEEMPTVEYIPNNSKQRKYVNDVKAMLVSNIDHWVVHKNIDLTQFDLNWYPHPYEPPYIYVWGNQYLTAEEMPTVEYHMPGAVDRKYMSDRKAKLISDENNWKINDKNIFPLQLDMKWTPHPHDPPYIYAWGNKWVPAELKPTIEYFVHGATEYKYMGNNIELLPEEDRWKILKDIDVNSFDFTWRPDPREPAFIYVWGNQYLSAEEMPTVEYHVPGAIDRKYMNDKVVKLANNPEYFVYHDNINKLSFDFTWTPHPYDPPYIYVWGNKWVPGEIKPTLEYHVPGATERKYMSEIVEVEPEWNKWSKHESVKNFDFSWRPNPTEPPYIYAWGNKHVPAEIKPSIEYYCEGATEIKYMPEIVQLEVQEDRWNILLDIDKSDIDFTWRPDPREPAFIYVWGNQHNPPEVEPTLEYHVPGATDRKYVHDRVINVLPEYENWVEVQLVDKSKFDFTWRPNPSEPPFVYVWGNKWIPGEVKSTIEYHVPGAIDKKYMTELVEVLPDNNWVEVQKIHKNSFDLSWRPDPSEPPFVYVWGNKWIPGEVKSTIEYHVPGATDYKYMPELVEVLSDDNWIEVQKIDKNSFDLSWRPDPNEPPYIYVWGNKWIPGELKSTLEYHVPGATEHKYMTDLIEVLPDDNWVEVQKIDKTNFDFTWRPDPREPAFIYVWGNQHNPPEVEPTLEYHVPGATEYKYMAERIQVIPDYNKWVEVQLVDKSKFDFTWRPNPSEPPFVYVWGNKWIPGEVKSTLEYHVPGATDRKYMSELVEVLPEDNWVEVQLVDKSKFDFTWRPDPIEPPYIYVWGNKWIPGELKSTLEYHVSGATEYKYMTELVEVLPEDNYIINLLIDKNSFDFTWRPDPREPAFIYVWGNQHNDAVKEPTVEYHVSGATEKKYMTDRTVTVLSEGKNWKQLIPNIEFDFSWRPDPHSPPYIYVWGNQWNSVDVEPTLEYHVPGATEYKYMTDTVALIKPSNKNWKINIFNSEFDFSWRPDPREPAFIYVWGNQHNDAVKEPTVEYCVPGATEKKYMNDKVAIVPPNKKNFKKLIPNVEFDFSWRPDPHSPPYIYVWGNQWNSVDVEPTLEYHVPGATEYKYMTDAVATVPKNRKNWKIYIEGADIDFSWRPDPREPAFIYVWGNKWNDAATEPTVAYVVPGATDRKYMNNMVATLPPTKRHWTVNRKEDLENFDFSWRPNPHSPPQIYQWEDNGPTYTVPGAEAVVFMKRDDKLKTTPVPRYYVKTSLEDLIEEHSNEVFWALNPDLTYEKFDFSWKPDENNFRHINVFGNELSKDTQTYYINGPMYTLGYKEYNYVEEQTVTVDTNLTMFYIDTGLSDCKDRFEKLKLRYPQIQKTRFLNSWVDTITRCVKKSETKLFWVLSSDYDYSEFEFDFYPSKWQMNMLHVFGTQYNHWGNTYLVNGESFLELTKYVKIVEHLKNINHVRSKRAKTLVCRHDILYIDHGNKDNGDNLRYFENLNRKVYVVSYEDGYLNTFKKFIEENKNLTSKPNYFIWVTNSICDYKDFDFGYQVDPFQTNQLHVFASEFDKARQKFGDTFLINLNEFVDNLSTFNDLEKYPNKVNYIEHISAKRKPHPVIKHSYDSQVEAIKNIEQDTFPYYELVHDNALTPKSSVISLWDDKKSIIVGSKGASHIFVPSVAIQTIKDEVYDYPYIVKAKNVTESKPLDIIFISNGEPIADENYETLISSLKKRNIPNRVTRVKDINGRVASQHVAANTSNTNWYFLVNGKVKVNDSFDWMWQPDRLQQPKHYIFTVTNPVNGLTYGHQAIVANNKKITLNTVMKGLDFTLDSLHEVVDMNCGTAIYNTDPWTTWRTAFRESIKLRNNNDSISKFRLERWTTYGTGNFCEFSQQGALDGIKYFESVNGDMDKLLLSYDWEWIQTFYNQKYGK